MFSGTVNKLFFKKSIQNGKGVKIKNNTLDQSLAGLGKVKLQFFGLICG